MKQGILLDCILKCAINDGSLPTLPMAMTLQERSAALQQQPATASVVLCSRGYSFVGRLPLVVDWAVMHGIPSVILLHCPEDRYETEFVERIERRAMRQFALIKAMAEKKGTLVPAIELVVREGSLPKNLETLVQERGATIVFAGAKMLDYHLEDIRRIGVPFYFIA